MSVQSRVVRGYLFALALALVSVAAGLNSDAASSHPGGTRGNVGRGGLADTYGPTVVVPGRSDSGFSEFRWLDAAKLCYWLASLSQLESVARVFQWCCVNRGRGQ